MRVTVLGAGAWGAALAKVLHENGNAVTLWDISAETLNELKGSVGGTKALVDRTAVIGAGAATPGEEPTTRSTAGDVESNRALRLRKWEDRSAGR